MTVPETPTTQDVRLACPSCGQAIQVAYEITAVLTATTDSDGVTDKTLKPKFRAQSVVHVCGQTSLEFRGEVE